MHWVVIALLWSFSILGFSWCFSLFWMQSPTVPLLCSLSLLAAAVVAEEWQRGIRCWQEQRCRWKAPGSVLQGTGIGFSADLLGLSLGSGTCRFAGDKVVALKASCGLCALNAWLGGLGFAFLGMSLGKAGTWGSPHSSQPFCGGAQGQLGTSEPSPHIQPLAAGHSPAHTAPATAGLILVRMNPSRTELELHVCCRPAPFNYRHGGNWLRISQQDQPAV